MRKAFALQSAKASHIFFSTKILCLFEILTFEILMISLVLNNRVLINKFTNADNYAAVLFHL